MLSKKSLGAFLNHFLADLYGRRQARPNKHHDMTIVIGRMTAASDL
jgi:hypothetical protein